MYLLLNMGIFRLVMLVFRGVCPDHPPVQKGHPKLLISKAAVDGIVAREIFFVQFLR